MSNSSNLIGRKSDVVLGYYGEPVKVTHALFSAKNAQAYTTRPLFIIMHGWGSNETDLAAIMRYVAPFNDYVALRAPIELSAADNAYSWFHDAVPVGEDLDYDAFAACNAIQNWVTENIEDSREIVLMGFSQGGMLSTHMLRVFPERYRAAINLSGFIAMGEISECVPADNRLAEMEKPVFFGYGDKDEIIPRYELFAASAWLEENTWLTLKHYPTLDHAVGVQEFNDIKQWLIMNGISSGMI
ncbi:MAG: dienelactone hydrolase family protein [Bifidobacteriaceae bacterium]|nr:dienelactone hydrolase family protein [Bifidobacteriaceae bacterium]